MTFVKFLNLLIIIIQVINVKNNGNTKEATSTIILSNTDETSKIEFSNGERKLCFKCRIW